MIKYIELYISIVVSPHALIFIYVDYLTGKNKMTILLPYFVLFSSTQFLNNNNKKNTHS